jgi:hypothetical protein
MDVFYMHHAYDRVRLITMHREKKALTVHYPQRSYPSRLYLSNQRELGD